MQEDVSTAFQRRWTEIYAKAVEASKTIKVVRSCCIQVQRVYLKIHLEGPLGKQSNLYENYIRNIVTTADWLMREIAREFYKAMHDRPKIPPPLSRPHEFAAAEHGNNISIVTYGCGLAGCLVHIHSIGQRAWTDGTEACKVVGSRAATGCPPRRARNPYTEVSGWLSRT